MSDIVIDSSALVEAVLLTPKGRRVNVRRSHGGVALHLPEACPIEVVSALRGLTLGGKLSVARANTAVADFSTIRGQRHSAHPFLRRIWDLRNNLTVYDATYVVLAEVLECPLVTTDAKFDTPPVRRLIEVEVIS